MKQDQYEAFTQTYDIVRLESSDIIKSFDCGDAILNDYILNQSSDAYYEAIPFYQKNGFIPLNEADVNDKTRLLYFDLNDVSD